MKTAIFLGGGASAAEGAPMQSELFRDYFALLKEQPRLLRLEMNREIEAYFREVFGTGPLENRPGGAEYPTFEEALGLLDLAVRRREGLRNFDLENVEKTSNRIGFIRQFLVLLMAVVIDNKTADIRGLHRLLIDSLAREGLLDDTVFVTTNYDILLDKAILAASDRLPDYGLPPPAADSPGDPGPGPVRLYKVHGSLNWLYCPVCNAITITGGEPGVTRLLDDPARSACAVCRSVMQPVIVPPTFFKDMSNIFLEIVWHKAEQTLRDVDRLVFCGYSFPDADMHVKYLIKRIQTNRAGELKISVVNNHPGKKPHSAAAERRRYRRFLGGQVEYTDLSFEAFAARPRKVLR